MSILSSFLALLPSEFEMVLADVGSAGGLKARWAPARRFVSAMLFEPRENAGNPRVEGRDTLYPVALGAEPGRATLNVTALPNMSSTLAPNAALMGGFRRKGEHTQIVSTFEMRVDALDAITAREGRRVDVLKVDTQGSELEILKGADATVRGSVVLAEIEVSFLERYTGQPLIGDMMTYMRERGFELIDLCRIKRYRSASRFSVYNLGMGAGHRAGRISYADAVFVLSAERLEAKIAAEGEMTGLRALVGLVIYGKVDRAARLFERTADAFGPDMREKLERWFLALGKRRLRGTWTHLAADWLQRHV
jgi:FkbM family methyltransferase